MCVLNEILVITSILSKPELIAVCCLNLFCCSLCVYRLPLATPLEHLEGEFQILVVISLFWNSYRCDLF